MCPAMLALELRLLVSFVGKVWVLVLELMLFTFSFPVGEGAALLIIEDI